MGQASTRNHARDDCIRILTNAGVTVTKMAEAFGVSDTTICKVRVRLGISSVPQTMVPLEGETWIDRPDLGVRVSDMGRFASMKTGYLLKISRSRYHDYITVKVKTPEQTTISTEYLIADTFGHERPIKVFANQYSELEDAIIKKAASFADAVNKLPARSPGGIKARAKRIGKKFGRAQRDVETAKGSVPYLHPLYTQASAVVPRGVPEDVRDDLISDLMLMALEGKAQDMRAAFKEVLRERNRMMGTYKERSLDACIGGTDLRLIDTIAADREHF